MTTKTTKTMTTTTERHDAMMAAGILPAGIRLDRFGRPAGILPAGYARSIGLHYSDSGMAACGCGGSVFCKAHPACDFDR